MVHRIADEIETMIIELGVDARLLRLQLDELYGDIDDELDLVVADYLPPGRTVADTLAEMSRLSDDDVLEPAARREHAAPRRRHRRTSTRRWPRRVCACSTGSTGSRQDLAATIADHFGGLSKLQRATVADLMAVDGVDEATATVDQGHARAASPNRPSSTSTADRPAPPVRCVR